MIGLKLKVLDMRQTGCDVWLTFFEVTDETGVEPVLPQHFIIYTEGKPDLNIGQRTSIHLFEQSDFGKERSVTNGE